MKELKPLSKDLSVAELEKMIPGIESCKELFLVLKLIMPIVEDATLRMEEILNLRLTENDIPEPTGFK